MKKIAVGMDFSQGALNALEYAVDVAVNTDSEITLLWVEPSSRDKVLPGERNEIRYDAKVELENLVEKIILKQPGLKVNFKQKRGKVYQEVASFAYHNQSDIVIIGTHGINGAEEFWVESNAYKIISYCPCPVISVRTDYRLGGNINRIILPIDDSLDTTKKVPMVVDMAKEFDAEIRILGVYNSDLAFIRKRTDKFVRETQKYLAENEVNHKFIHCTSNNISASLVKYAENDKADLMVIMTDQNKATSDMLMGRVAQQIINQSPIPVLSVKPDKMIFNT
ncbi:MULTISPECIES: universal stress protein [unclassified Lentimicrobium]|uniref:universal stress protein n=1 Tax=unclassified Lentimicrobium TaxID=2677434 RepID=UPI00155536CA|nr:MULTISPECIES: universal stress protein [unclassified Lentimicrobium]NPD45972.1 universal stress protein [Lentimicrobium sp. S6]NPD84261.1 universal stress protein [Lentimicrobium sp. L6]